MVVAACPRSSADAGPGDDGLKRGVGHGGEYTTGYLVSNRHNSFSDMELTVGSRTDVGPRKMNQDHLGWWPELGLFVVADGMGGHNAGEVASHLAVETIRDFIAESADAADITWPFGLEVDELDRHEPPDDGGAPGEPQDLRRGHEESRSERHGHDGGGRAGRRAIASRSSASATAASIGCGSGALEQLTKDDTWLASVLGEKQAEDADPQHPLRHVLTSVVGTQDDVKPGVARRAAGRRRSVRAVHATACTASSIARRSPTLLGGAHRRRPMARRRSWTKRSRAARPTTRPRSSSTST